MRGRIGFNVYGDYEVYITRISIIPIVPDPRPIPIIPGPGPKPYPNIIVDPWIINRFGIRVLRIKVWTSCNIAASIKVREALCLK